MKIDRAANDVGRTERSDVPAGHGAIAGAASRCSLIRPTWFNDNYTEKYFRIVRVFRGQQQATEDTESTEELHTKPLRNLCALCG
ncbi:hypothetical protein FHS27_003919 [Rhodopirellula rubra]|uniref:Uncharacterized protein n=1 Tax=Aporhodopirellula rubra TaxID=980271 RepID=A0A7W5E1I1_9BACT|nr:hypothetical protein [Aporhodopirellula rubra]